MAVWCQVSAYNSALNSVSRVCNGLQEQQAERATAILRCVPVSLKGQGRRLFEAGQDTPREIGWEAGVDEARAKRPPPQDHLQHQMGAKVCGGSQKRTCLAPEDREDLLADLSHVGPKSFSLYIQKKKKGLKSLGLLNKFIFLLSLSRPVVSGCAGYAMAHPDFGRSVNPISTRGDRLCPPNYYWHPRIFRPFDGPDYHIHIMQLYVVLTVDLPWSMWAIILKFRIRSNSMLDKSRSFIVTVPCPSCVFLEEHFNKCLTLFR